jgi:Ca-activated chloride channel homolog
MNFTNPQYWPYVLLGITFFTVMVLVLEKWFFGFIKKYWFYRRSLWSYIASALFLLGAAGLMLSLLDLRGPEERVKASVPTDRTIILIDTSASMLAEDVKPSRLQKATLIAKHFARKAPGHQISIVAFSEIQKKIVPFTADLDLIDARLDSIKNLQNQYGSSAITTAIQESIQYLLESSGPLRGNLLVLTDGEETAEGLKLKVPKEVHVALVGIGTTQGGRIPLDDSRGFRFGYKKHGGQDIITKLNEGFFKNTVEAMPSARYWIAGSFNLPSEEIIDFFQSEKVKGMGEQDMVIRPVMMEWIVLPSLLLIALSYLFKNFRTFALSLLLVAGQLQANSDQVELAPEIVQQLGLLQQGKLNRMQKIKLADELSRAGLKAEGRALYEENLRAYEIEKNIPPEAYLNYGTTLLETGDGRKGMEVYKSLDESLGSSPEANRLRDMMDQNITSFLAYQEQKKREQQKKQDQNKNQKPKKGQQGSGSDKSRSQQDNSKGQSGQEQDPNPKQGEDKNEEQGDQGKDKDQNDKDGDDKPDDQQDQNRERESNKPLPQRKVPAKLKQLMSDDRQLQMKIIENGTRDLNKRKSRDSKDW